MIIADTSGLLAYFNASEPAHASVVAALDSSSEVVVPPFVVAELDYLIATRHGVNAEVAVLKELASGGWLLPEIGADDLGQIAAIVHRYRDQAIGAADASIVLLAERFKTKQVLTLDRRHFSVLRPLAGGRFSIIPT